MMSIADFHEGIPGIAEVPLIGILRGAPIERISEIIGAAKNAGLRVVEVTLDSDSALEQIRLIVRTAPGMTVGAGSVTRVEEIEKVIEAGARFIVSPVSRLSIIAECRTLGVPSLPGAATPTEIHRALEAGATAVKVFPAEQLGGPSYLEAVMSPLREPPLVPTGGVTLGNADKYLAAGAAALGVGSALLPSGPGSATSDRVGEDVARWVQMVIR